ncbi:16312_t:CDS:2 [Cetraspora pellucida]|uniref:16312_t:CDS:1 n=1 Tax=Cetraspora pellucida TaxID=1433469 RepID=A0A9N9A6Y5_9GLOM|nr:16312_t:CDS:2 [Cetraspora pellucida]
MSVRDQFEDDQTVNGDEYNNQQHLNQTTLLLQKIAQMATNYEKLTTILVTRAEISSCQLQRRQYQPWQPTNRGIEPRRPFTSPDRNRPQYWNVNMCDIYFPEPEKDIYAIKQCESPEAEHGQPIPMEVTSDEQTPIVSQLAVPRRKRGASIVNFASKPLIPATEESNIIDNNYNKKSIATKCYVQIQNNPILVVLDSEAAVSIISKKLARKLNLEITELFNTVVVIINSTRE